MTKSIRLPVRSKLALAIPALLLAAACSSAEKKFERITPGMTAAEVRETMDEGPTSFQVAESPGYSRWRYGEDLCVLFRDERVVAKESARAGTNASVGPAKYEEKKAAQCLVPGQASTAGTDRTVEVPGLGTIHLPGSKLSGSTSGS